MNKNGFFSARRLTWLAILSALVVVLQLWGSQIKILGVSMNLSLVPIVLGAIMLGVWGGAILGFINGLVVLIAGITGMDPFTNFLFSYHPVLTAFTCIVKTTLAGVLSGLVYNLVKNKHKYLGTFLSSVIVPVVNTTVFILCALLMSNTVSMLMGDSPSVIYFLVIGCAGINFLIELALNLVLAPALYRVICAIERS